MRLTRVSLKVGLQRLSREYEVVRLEFVRVTPDDFWWSINCKRKSTQRKWDISMGGWPTPLSVVRDALGKFKLPAKGKK